MSPPLTVLACDRIGCQQKSNGDEWTWGAANEAPEGVLRVQIFMSELTMLEGYKFYCGHACTSAAISAWMAKQRNEK